LYQWDYAKDASIIEIKQLTDLLDASWGTLYIYDASRNKVLSTDHTMYTFGRATLNTNLAGYLTMDGASHSSTVGVRPPYNGTLLSATVDNATNITRNFEIRIDNSTKNTLSLVNSNKGYLLGLNTDFSTGNIIHIYVPSTTAGNALSNTTFSLEVAWKI
jgi:hypothetical protein